MTQLSGCDLWGLRQELRYLWLLFLTNLNGQDVNTRPIQGYIPLPEICKASVWKKQQIPHREKERAWDDGTPVCSKVSRLWIEDTLFFASQLSPTWMWSFLYHVLFMTDTNIVGYVIWGECPSYGTYIQVAYCVQRRTKVIHLCNSFSLVLFFRASA